MANSLYDIARARFATAQLDWLTGTYNIVLLDVAAYTFDPTHQYYNEVAVGARVASVALINRTVAATGGIKADSPTIPLVTGPSVEAMLIYKDTGTEATSPLIIYLDTVQGLPFTPTGGNVLVSLNQTDSGIFRL